MDALTRAGYLAHAMSDDHRRRVAAASQVCADHPSYALSTSWGKDSVAALLLAIRVRPDLVILNARYPHPAERIGDLDRVRDIVLARPEMARARYVEVDCPGEWEMYERAGCAFGEPSTADQRDAARWWKAEFTSRLRSAMVRAGCTGVMLGLRQAESRARRLNVATRGTSYTRADGLAVALPVARLTGADIWAVTVGSDAPWLRVYDAAPDRETARSGLTWSTGAIDAVARHGGVALWQRVYPDEIAAWFARWPELRIASHV